MSALEPTADEIAAAARRIRRSVLPGQISPTGTIAWDASAAVTIGTVAGILDCYGTPGIDGDQLIREAKAAIAAHIERDQQSGADR